MEQNMLMKNKLLYYSLAFFIFSVCSCSCDKNGDGDPNNGNWTIPQEVKDYTLFKPGTYWIYEDSATGVLDSVYVYDLQTGIDSTTNGNFEYFYEYCMHSIDGHSDDFWVHTQWSKQYQNTTVWKEKFKPGDYIGQTYLMIYPFDLNRRYGCYTDDIGAIITVRGVYDQLTILGTDFGNAVCFHDTKNITEGHVESSYFIAKNFGLVRSEIPDSSKIWNLIRYNIVQ